ncbi:MAG: ATP-binding protein, partial [Eubacteriales bacterium]
MKQPKKIFKKLCLNNWGGISHEVLEFHESVNLFSGKSGSGKSTVMDAVQVILYGSFSSSFLNKAADDAKNRRSVLSYLRGEQKDGSANRAGQDFCTIIALEIEDTGTHIVHCVGLAFEVRKTDTDVRKSTFFSHSGRMPEDGYTNENGVPYTIKEIKEFIDERKQSPDNRGKFDVNRTYVTKESYLGVLNDAIMGYVDGPRFTTMEKSAIALRMTNGTGQFIKDYMFPKNNSDAIQNISEELGAYQEIKEQIQDIKARIDVLTEIRNHGRKILDAQMDEIKATKTIQCIDIIQTKQKIQEKSEMLNEIQSTLDQLEKEADNLQEQKVVIEDELIEVSAELKSSDLGRKQENLKELEERGEILSSNYGQWKSIVANILKWEQDEIITDYVSNPMLNRISEFANGKVTVESCQTLHENIKSTKENLEVELDDYNDQRRVTHKLIEEKQQLIDDIQKNQKSYGEQVRRARTALSQKLSTIYGRSISVQVFADLFDVQGESWKNAIEGRMGRLKTSLITEPQYAHDAAKIFREMKEFEQVELIHSKAVAESNPLAKEGSLYEEVKTEYPYVDKCLQRYLGNVIKCDSVKDLEQVRDGVTKDCYAYSNFIFRHLKEKDYTIYACIGTKVSKAKLKGYEEELRELEAEYREQCRMADAFKHAR